ncbi:unnamed protein product [Phyllotreta striolata]|uniref:Uncharacterized protein n=1 Tax=Phyllotreta striolata TaxID=444603 RepID=A0A9N9TN89_PHYSR|nr:unnamed protein product [Phyllotreta striolata]
MNMAESNRIKDLNVEINVLNAQVAVEEKAKLNWYKKWGIYLDFHKILLEEIGKRGITEEKYKKLTGGNRKMVHINKETPCITIQRSEYVPKTSNGMVGRRSDYKYNLEIMGPLYVSPKSTLPRQSSDYCIKLG